MAMLTSKILQSLFFVLDAQTRQVVINLHNYERKKATLASKVNQKESNLLVRTSFL